MLQEIRQKYHYPGKARFVKIWVEGCQNCAKDERVPDNTITPDLLNLANGTLDQKTQCQ